MSVHLSHQTGGYPPYKIWTSKGQVLELTDQEYSDLGAAIIRHNLATIFPQDKETA